MSLSESYDDSPRRETRAKEKKALKVGDFVGGLLFHTGIVCDISAPKEPLVETWGYGRTLAKIPSNQIYRKDWDESRWFKAAVDGAVRQFGESCRPTHEVSKAAYSKALSIAAGE